MGMWWPDAIIQQYVTVLLFHMERVKNFGHFVQAEVILPCLNAHVTNMYVWNAQIKEWLQVYVLLLIHSVVLTQVCIQTWQLNSSAGVSIFLSVLQFTLSVCCCVDQLPIFRAPLPVWIGFIKLHYFTTSVVINLRG
jgi:hypothetical protein